MAKRLQAFKLHVAPVQTLFVFLFQNQGAQQSSDPCVVGEDAHHVASALDFTISDITPNGRR